MSAEVTLISNVNNCQVVQVAGRRFPGIVMQGDSLITIVDLASEVMRLIKEVNIVEAGEAAEELHGLLAARLQVYTETLRRKGLPLP